MGTSTDDITPGQEVLFEDLGNRMSDACRCQFPSPEATVTEYWNLVNSRQFTSAWGLLSKDFRAIRHPKGFEDYENGNKDRYCRIHVASAARDPEADKAAGMVSVTTELVFVAGPTCGNQYSRTFDILLVQEGKPPRWLIDRVSQRSLR